MKRTTLTLDEQVFVAIRKRAAAEGRTFKEVVNELLRQALAQSECPDTGYKLRWRPMRGKGVQPGVNLDDRDALWDLMEGQVIRAVDTNILVYAHRSDSVNHEAARALVQSLAQGVAPWAIPWPCVYEFLRVVTHPRVFHPPTPLSRVWADLESLLASPSLRCLGETGNHAAMLAKVLSESPVKGNLMHDAHIAALLREHGVGELYTADADFKRFDGFRATNPFHPA